MFVNFLGDQISEWNKHTYVLCMFNLDIVGWDTIDEGFIINENGLHLYDIYYIIDETGK